MSGTAAQQSNSKASTVELAIEYIKGLQAELRDVKGRLEVYEKGASATTTTTMTTATDDGTGTAANQEAAT